jgi:hypothetical protein
LELQQTKEKGVMFMENENEIKRGVYFLGNNFVHELAIAWLNSFRRFNPDIPLCFIPFDDDCSKIISLKEQYQFTIFNNQSSLETCDAISLKFHEKVHGAYRKFVAWEGEFDEFIYIDVDTLVMCDVSFAYRFLDTNDFVVSDSNKPELREWVWKESIYSADVLTNEQIEYAANTGFVMSKKGLLTIDKVWDKLKDALPLAKHMQLLCQEQPFLVYLIITSGRPYTSLWSISVQTGDETLPLEMYAGFKGGVIKRDSVSLAWRKNPVLMVHWPGLWRLGRTEKMMMKLLHFAGFRKLADRNVRRFFMPYKKLWNYYRYLGQR